MKATDKRMTAERWQLDIFFAANNFQRCAELSLVAIVNKLPESWICFRPVLPLMYASQYLPGISKFVFSLKPPGLFSFLMEALKITKMNLLCARIVMTVLGPAFLARVRDSRNAMESEKLK